MYLTLVSNQVVHGLSIPLGKLGYLAPRRINRVLSESFSVNEDQSAAGSRIPIIGRWFSGSKDDVEAGAGARAGVLEANSRVVAEGSQPRTADASLETADQRLPRAAEHSSDLQPKDTSSQEDEDAMPARRREIRFYDEPDPRNV